MCAFTFTFAKKKSKKAAAATTVKTALEMIVVSFDWCRFYGITCK